MMKVMSKWFKGLTLVILRDWVGRASGLADSCGVSCFHVKVYRTLNLLKQYNFWYHDLFLKRNFSLRDSSTVYSHRCLEIGVSLRNGLFPSAEPT